MIRLLLFSLSTAIPAFLSAQFSGGSQARDQSAGISAVDSAVVVESGSQLLVALGPQIGVPYWIALSYTGQLGENLPA